MPARKRPGRSGAPPEAAPTFRLLRLSHRDRLYLALSLTLTLALTPTPNVSVYQSGEELSCPPF